MIPAACTAKSFWVSVLCIQIAAYRAYLTCKIRCYLEKVTSFLIQCFHQLSLKLSPGKCWKHSINLTALIKFLNIQLFNRSQCIFGNAVHIGCDWFLDLVIQPCIVAAFFTIWCFCRLNHSFQAIHLFDERTSHILWQIMFSQKVLNFSFLVSKARKLCKGRLYLFMIKVNYRTHGTDCPSVRCMKTVRDSGIHSNTIRCCRLLSCWIIGPANSKVSLSYLHQNHSCHLVILNLM